MDFQGPMRFTEWKDYFFSDYVIESCNNYISERKENQIDCYDYTVKINEGEFFSFSKDRNEIDKSLDHSVNSQNNDNFEVKYLTPFQSDENAIQIDDESLFAPNNNLTERNSELEKCIAPENSNNKISVSISDLTPDNNDDKEEYRLKKKIDKEPNDENINSSSLNNLPINTIKNNSKVKINVINDIPSKVEKNELDLVVNKNVSKTSDLVENNNFSVAIENSLQQANFFQDHFNDLEGNKKENETILKKEISLNTSPNIMIKEFNEDDLDKNADTHIKELQDKLHTLKFQNSIVMDENAKLLEILHLYKIIQSIECTEKNKEDPKKYSMPIQITEPNNEFDTIRKKNEIDSINKSNKLITDNLRSKFIQTQSTNISHSSTIKTKLITNQKASIQSDKINPPNKPRFKQFIDKANINLINKKTYKQLHSNNDTYSKTNISINNSRVNEKNISLTANQNYNNSNNNFNTISKITNRIEETKCDDKNQNKPSNITLSNDLIKNSQLSILNFPPLKNTNIDIINSIRNNQFLENSHMAIETIDKNNKIEHNLENTFEINLKCNHQEDNSLILKNNYEIQNDEDFNQNYESLMNYFNKYKEADSKIIENLIIVEENNENSLLSNKDRRKKNLQNLEEFYNTNVEPKSKETNQKDNSRYNMLNSKSFSDKFILSENSNCQNNLKLIPFHLIEKKKLLINMMNYLYGKNIFNWKKQIIA